MTSVREQGQPTQRSQAFEAPTGSPSSNGDHKDPLGLNKPRPSEAHAGSKALAGPEIPAGLEAPPGPPQALLLPVPQDPGANRYSQQNLDKIIQTFLHTSKGGSGDKLKAKTPDVYRGRSHMKCYNFHRQYEDHFTTCGATKLNRISFAAFFLRDQINFR